MEINEKLKHLKEKEIEDLISKYYDGNNVSKLIKEYNVDCRPSELYKLFPQIIHAEKCPYCNVNLREERRSKSTPSYLIDKYAPGCPICEHQVSEYCKCKNCESERLRLINEKKIEEKKIVEDFLNEINRQPIQFSEIEFEERVYLGALLREAYDPRRKLILPFDHHDDKFAPTKHQGISIVKHLFERNIIRISSETEIVHFIDEFDRDNPVSFYDAFLELNIEGVSDDMIDELMNPNEGFDIDTAFNLWLKIAVYEIWEMIIYDTKNLLNHTINVTEKATLTFMEILKRFSVCHVRYMLYHTINQTLRIKNMPEFDGDMFKLVNGLPNRLLNYSERAIVNNWDMGNRGTFRLKNCEQSTLSIFFFNRVIKIGEKGFTESPSIAHLTNDVANAE